MKSGTEGFDLLHISLTAPLNLLYDRIDQRVQKRMDMGFLDEIKKILKKYSWSDPGLQIGAYQCMKPCFQNEKTSLLVKERSGEAERGLKVCLQKWQYAEHSDARRQGTYLKSRYKNTAQFFDITSPNFKNKIFKIVSKWYNEL